MVVGAGSPLLDKARSQDRRSADQRVAVESERSLDGTYLKDGPLVFYSKRGPGNIQVSLMLCRPASPLHDYTIQEHRPHSPFSAKLIVKMNAWSEVERRGEVEKSRLSRP